MRIKKEGIRVCAMKLDEDIYIEYADLVYRYILALCRDENIAEEITQECFYQAILSIQKYDEKACKLSTFLCAIAKNKLREYQRKERQSTRLIEYDQQYISKSLESILIEDFEKRRVYEKLCVLDERDKEIIYLRIFSELSFKDIAAILGISENCARVSYFRAKARIKKEVENEI